METKHTPGPWTQGKATPQNVSAGSALICRTFARSRAGDEDRANARLIAAAPELLQALKHIDDTAVLDNECDTASKTWGAILAARAAIAKAEGK